MGRNLYSPFAKLPRPFICFVTPRLCVPCLKSSVSWLLEDVLAEPATMILLYDMKLVDPRLWSTLMGPNGSTHQSYIPHLYLFHPLTLELFA